MGHIKHFVFVLVFLVIFAVSFHFVTHIFTYKMGENDTINSFYKEPNDSIDVLFVGSSHAYSSFSPMELWNEAGISSYNLGSSSQSIPCSYYLIKEGIRTQHPQIVVLETYGAKYDEDYVSSARLHIALDGIPFGQTKMEIMTEFLPRTMSLHERLEYYFPIIRFHSRWTELRAMDFHPRNLCLKGYHLSCKVTQLNEPVPETDTHELYSGTLEYFQRIIDLCNDNNIELILCNAPMGQNAKYTETNMKVNELIEYAKKQSIPCINFENLREELDIDYNTDFRDDEHLNLYGMRKVMSYLVTYFSDNYNLTDHRREDDYKDWNHDYDDYLMLIAKEKR
ncbi:MAG: hypothetical protein IJ801_02100 [Lachnospiraceae bacterium]|nr:hypothetical protein [Lachnospiraceae bacterium]